MVHGAISKYAKKVMQLVPNKTAACSYLQGSEFQLEHFLFIRTQNLQWLVSLDGFAPPQWTWWTDWPQRTWTIRVLDLHGSSNARDFSCKAWNENPSRL